jgi:hypothetical protein
MSCKRFTKYANFDSEYDSDEPIDDEEREEQCYNKEHNAHLKYTQKNKHNEQKFKCEHKYKHEQVLYYGSSKCKIRTLVDGGGIPNYRVYPYYSKNNIPIEKLYKLISGKNLSDYNQRIYQKYEILKCPVIGKIVYTGELEPPLKKTLAETNHYEWSVSKLNDDGTFNLERTDDDADLMKFVLENELSETPY